MKKTDIDTIEKFIKQAVHHLPSMRVVNCVEVSNFFITFRLANMTIDSDAIIALAKCSKMKVEVIAGSRLGIKFAIGLCVTDWDTEYSKIQTANLLTDNYSYQVLITK